MLDMDPEGPSTHGNLQKFPKMCNLTFQSARTSRARSRRPPKVLPRMIQMGICDSSGLEISNVIWEERKHHGFQAEMEGERGQREC